MLEQGFQLLVTVVGGELTAIVFLGGVALVGVVMALYVMAALTIGDR